MITIKALFTYVPYAALLVVFLAFVRTCRLSVRAQAVWTMVLLLAFSKFLCFGALGGDVFYPDFPEKLVWAWNGLYSGAVILSVLSVPTCFWRSRAKAVVLPLLAWTLSAVGLWNGLKPPQVREIELAFADLPAELDGYRIAQVSDIHCSCAARRWRTQAVVDLVNSLDADLICLLGDFADGQSVPRVADIEPIRDFRAKDGVWAVTGNHEYYFDYVGWTSVYHRLGVRFLVNECVFPRKSLALGGVNDFAVALVGGTFPDVGKAFAAATNGEFRVLMQHQPREAHANLEGRHVDLQLSGHTHGGIMPGLRPLVARSNNGFLRGVYSFGKRKLSVCCGAGQWAGFPMRFFTPSEITLITLRR